MSASYRYSTTVSTAEAGACLLAQAIDYRYNTRDWVVALNKLDRSSFDDFSGRPENLFGMELGYQNQGDFAGHMNADKRYSGNVAWLMWAIKDVKVNIPQWSTETEQIGYVPEYDKAGRVTKVRFGMGINPYYLESDEFKLDSISYDPAGNFDKLKRRDETGDLMDDYTYNYYSGSHRLERIEDEEDYEGGQPDQNYRCDGNGNILRDKAAGIGFIFYDIFNRPIRYYSENGQQFNCDYDHEGRRIKLFDGDQTRYYINDPKGRPLIIATSGSDNLILNLLGLENEGYLDYTSISQQRYYYLRDHVGSVRMISDENGNAVAWTDYYPFGMPMPGRSGNPQGVDDRFKFTGKACHERSRRKRDAMTGYDYSVARYGAVPYFLVGNDFFTFLGFKNTNVVILTFRGALNFQSSIVSVTLSLCYFTR